VAKWLPNVADSVADMGKKAVSGLATWATGVADATVEAIGRVFLQLANETALAMGTFCAHLDEMFLHLRSITQEHKWNGFGKAMLSLAHALGGLFVDVVGTVAAVVLNLVVDVYGGFYTAVLGARPLTPEERAFAHSIFHGSVNVSHVRLRLYHIEQGGGMVAANVIWMPKMDLDDRSLRSLFAHELTHVYQDQDTFSSGTLGASRDLLNNLCHIPKAYDLHLQHGTQWEDLRLEQQAELVGKWQFHLDKSKPELHTMIEGEIPDEQIPFAKAIVEWKDFF
jgi:hypothetical protein